MPKPFIPLTLSQFREMLGRFPFSRTIDVVHMHHTWRPNHAQYRGLETIEGMHAFHTRERGFSDIAQHITIAPDGTIWTGRNWNVSPASAVGFNGNSRVGPFMFEMIGDFDAGKDPFDDPQRETVLQVIVAVQKKFGLPPEALRFHRQMSTKTCPGSALDLAAIVELVRARHVTAPVGARDLAEAPFSAAYREDPLGEAQRRMVDGAVDALRADRTVAESAADAELPESEQEVVITGTGQITSAAARGVELTTADLIALRAHVINLSQGLLTDGGEFFTLPEDVERIFGEDMERAFADPQSVGMPPRATGEPFRIMVWAHGGLISEANGLAIAQKHLAFWKRNGIYPVYFVWETGLFQTIGHLLRGLLPGADGARNVFSDNISDPLLETGVRAAGGEKIWSGMKRNAELAATPTGGATKTAAELKKFLDRHPRSVSIHAAGHSAGAIFQAHFLPAAVAAGIAEISSLHLLAPAIRVDTFARRLVPLVGTSVKRLSLFTMLKEQELDDTCAEIYRKSLLYLIRFALEQERSAEILGLEECLRRDRDVAKLFGLGGAPSQKAEAIFSPSVASDGPRATQSTTHGGFDDDAATMNSVALQILGLATKAQLPMPYPAGQRVLTTDPWTVPEVEELRRSFASVVSGFGAGGWWTRPTPAAPPARPPAPAPGPVTGAPPTGGRRRALCVGIDRYPVQPLAGCVRDARLWAQTLGRFGFEAELLLDGDATYENIGARLERLIRGARSGDVIVWQYSGHGTQVPDVNGDEAGGDSPGQDEAICPVDLQTGRMFVDDQIAALIAQLPAGVAFTMIMDCCHSGTLNRFGFGEPPDGSVLRDERPRFLPLTDDLKAAYLRFAAENRSRGMQRSRTRAAIQQTNEVLFTACLSTEVAWESNGQGEFTVRATRLLEERGLGFTNEEFIRAVTQAFGANARQTPTLACAAPLRGRTLLTAQADGGPHDRGGSSWEATNGLGRLADAVENFARDLRRA